MSKILEKNESYFIGDFKVLLDEKGALKITAVGTQKDNIRIEPISVNNIKVHAIN